MRSYTTQLAAGSALMIALLIPSIHAASPTIAPASRGMPGSKNKPERLEWFRDLGFGLFIHWNVDGQLGSDISHPMVAADDDFLTRYITELPGTFNPNRFAPQDLAVLSKLAGFRYVVFTTKHHSGFCMWPTATTDFNIAHTPFKRDIVREVFDAFSAQGLARGVYFSPDDFWWLHKNGKTLQRRVPGVQPVNNPGLMAHDLAQVTELMKNYAPVDMVFFDGDPTGLRERAWELKPDVVVTRGAITTPEQNIPGFAVDEAWEACVTMGTAWQYQPTNERYKSGGELLALLIETRAKGGNLLLNVGLKPNGELPIEQEDRMREIALWMFVNRDCIYGVRPWVITNEGDVWFTREKNDGALYVIVKQNPAWAWGTWRELVLHSVRATAQTTVTVLGQNDRVLEYQPDVTPTTTFEQKSDGLHVRAMRAQRLYNNRKWPNPIVLKITHAEPALVPPRIDTARVSWDAASGAAMLVGSVQTLGDVSTLEAGFEYRDITGMDLTERAGTTWQSTETQRVSATGDFFAKEPSLRTGREYEVRAFVKHPLLTLYGRELRVAVP